MTLRAGGDDVAVEVDPDAGARLTSMRFFGHEVLTTASLDGVPESITRGSYPMVPWAGRIGHGRLERHGRVWDLPTESDGHALHGLGRDLAWAQDGPLAFSVEIGEPWPVRGTARLDYALGEDRLHARLRWDGNGPGASLGFHPWFRRRIEGVEARLEVEPLDQLERGTDGLPTGRVVPPSEQPWDDCFTLAKPPRIVWPGLLALTLYADTDFWVIFTEPDHALCVEPQTAPPDAFSHPRWQSYLQARELRFTIVAESLR